MKMQHMANAEGETAEMLGFTLTFLLSIQLSTAALSKNKPGAL